MTQPESAAGAAQFPTDAPMCLTVRNQGGDIRLPNDSPLVQAVELSAPAVHLRANTDTDPHDTRWAFINVADDTLHVLSMVLRASTNGTWTLTWGSADDAPRTMTFVSATDAEQGARTVAALLLLAGWGLDLKAEGARIDLAAEADALVASVMVTAGKADEPGEPVSTTGEDSPKGKVIAGWADDMRAGNCIQFAFPDGSIAVVAPALKSGVRQMFMYCVERDDGHFAWFDTRDVPGMEGVFERVSSAEAPMMCALSKRLLQLFDSRAALLRSCTN